jgi:hypothetical protein
VLGVVIAVAAMVIAPWLAGPGLLGLASGTAAFGVAQALIAGGIVPTGPIALDALFPPGGRGYLSAL